MYKRRIINVSNYLCACNHGPTNAYGAATAEEEKDMNLRGSGESMRGPDRV